MDPGLRDQRRYLVAQLDAARGEPVTHRCQLAALDRDHALALAAADAPSYRRASGDLFECARAAWLDRVMAHARVAAAHDDPWTARAMAIELDATLGARGHADWTDALTAGSTAAQAWHTRAATARASFAAVITAITQAAWDHRAGSQAEAQNALAEQVPSWRRLEPVDAGSLEAVLAQPRYAAVLPWRGAGLAALTARVAAALGPRVVADEPVAPAADTLARMDAAIDRYLAALPHATPGPCATAEPTVADVVSPYAGLAALPGDVPVVVALRAAAQALVRAAEGATTPQGVLAAWCEGDLLAALSAAPVRAEAEATLARTAVWPDPLRAAGARALLDDLSGTRTGTEIDLISMHHGACALIEATWIRGWADVALAPVAAAAIAGWDPSARSLVPAAWALARKVAAVDADVVTTPLAATVLTAMVAHRHAVDLGAYLGEFGHGLVGEARAWFGVTGANPADARDVAALLTAAWGPVPHAAPAAVMLWGQAIALAHLGEVVPARPPVPGRSRRRVS